MTQLWEILVPTVRNDGRPYRLRYHRVWDAKVRAITGGLTIVSAVKGQWVDPETCQLYAERMIPVRVACSEDQLDKIIELTLEHYDDQIAIMAYRVSECVKIVRRKSA